MPQKKRDLAIRYDADQTFDFKNKILQRESKNHMDVHGRGLA